MKFRDDVFDIDEVKNKTYIYDGNKITKVIAPYITEAKIDTSVTRIGWSAFYNCSRLTHIEIPSSVTGIGWSAFSSCSSLTSIKIPNSVMSIGWDAFAGCDKLTIYCEQDSYAEQYAIKNKIPVSYL